MSKFQLILGVAAGVAVLCQACSTDTGPVPEESATWCITSPSMDNATKHRAVTGVMDLMKTTIIEDGSVVLLNRVTLTDADRNLFQVLPHGDDAKWALVCSDPFRVERAMTAWESPDSFTVSTFSTVDRTNEAARAQMVRVTVASESASSGAFNVVNKVDKVQVDMVADQAHGGFAAAKGAFVIPLSGPAMACEPSGGQIRCPFGVEAGGEAVFDFELIPGTESGGPRGGADLVTFDRTSSMAAEDAALAEFMDRLPGIDVPDPWYVYAFYSSAWLINIFRDRFDDLYLVKPGAYEYNSFWNRDAAYISRTMDVLGLHDRAEESMRIFWRHPLPDYINDQGTWDSSIEQKTDGRWEAPNNEWDGQGQVTWALVGHYRFTRDAEFLASVYPAVKLAMDWMIANIAERPSGHFLLPSGYGETLDTWNYVLNHNYWGVLGFSDAAWLARAAAQDADAELFGGKAEWFRGQVVAASRDAFVGDYDDGYIASAIGTSSVRAWGAIGTVYPSRVLDPWAPEVTATFESMWDNRAQDQYRFEDDDNRIWTYMSAEWAQALLIRGEWERAWTLMRGFRTQASPVFGWWEEKYLDSGKGRGDSPHGWAAADFVLWLRTMLVREVQPILPGGDPELSDPADGMTVELLGGVPPEWYVQGHPIVVSGLPTTFGRLESMAVTTVSDREMLVQAEFTLFDDGLDFAAADFRVLVSLRGADVESVECESGNPLALEGGFSVAGSQSIDCTVKIVPTAS